MTPPASGSKALEVALTTENLQKVQIFQKTCPLTMLKMYEHQWHHPLVLILMKEYQWWCDFKIDSAAQTVTTPGGRKHKNMPFDYVEMLRVSLASSIATDVEDDFDGKANPIRMNSYNLSSNAGAVIN